MGVVVWSPLSQGWLTGKWRHNQKPNDTNRQNLQPHLYDMSRQENQRKLDLVDALSDIAASAGMTLLQMALGFTVAHPAVTSAIIGPRTPEQLDGLLQASDITLGDDVLDAIDAVVAPGSNVSRDDDGYEAPEIADRTLRRRTAMPGTHEAARETLRNIEAYRQQHGDS
jgi:aryl-alcohol dehydrogenase-like predicted oxidoreductase